MPRLTKFEEYCDRYSDSYVLEKTDDGILLVRMHTDGGPVNWNKAVLSTPNLFADIAGDRDVARHHAAHLRPAGTRRLRVAPGIPVAALGRCNDDRLKYAST